MTIAQANKFYEQDNKKYDLSKNKDLLVWLKEIIEKGYHSYMNIETMQELIDNIVFWYETKYPEREMEFYEGIIYNNFENIEPLSKFMNINQLMFRLPHNQLCFIKCHYRANGGGNYDIYNDKGEVIGYRSVLFIPIKRKISSNNFDDLPEFLLVADSKDGNLLIDHNIKNINNNSITLDELLDLFIEKKLLNFYDYTELNDCIYDHKCDLELRNRILQLAALKLLYSKNTIPERGYERAKRFINEFNKRLNINLSTEEIDEALNRNYDDTKENLYFNVENTIKKEEFSKIKSLVKSIFNN